MIFSLEYVFLGNSLRAWLTALIIAVAVMLVVRLLKSILIKRLQLWAQKTSATFDDLLIKIVGKYVLPALYFAGIFSGIAYLSLPKNVNRIVHIAGLVIFTYYLLRTITAVVHYFIFSYIRKQDEAEHKERQARGLIITINIVIWIAGLVFFVDNLGYDVTTVIAGLGIGGVAIALAAQAILGDLFSYFVIFFDKPFEIGDFIVIEDKAGTVEYIGIKTTRLRMLSGEQLVCANADLTGSRVHNYKRMDTRRVVFTIGVTYETPVEKLQAIPGMIKDIILQQDKLVFDRAHFSAFADSSLNFEVVFIVQASDYNFYMDIQQAIYFDIVKAFAAEGIEFAYPTTSLFIRDMPQIKFPKPLADDSPFHDRN
jgi:small-conductance mechanosensitive channel